MWLKVGNICKYVRTIEAMALSCTLQHLQTCDCGVRQILQEGNIQWYTKEKRHLYARIIQGKRYSLKLVKDRMKQLHCLTEEYTKESMLQTLQHYPLELNKDKSNRFTSRFTIVTVSTSVFGISQPEGHSMSLCSLYSSHRNHFLDVPWQVRDCHGFV